MVNYDRRLDQSRPGGSLMVPATEVTANGDVPGLFGSASSWKDWWLRVSQQRKNSHSRDDAEQEGREMIASR